MSYPQQPQPGDHGQPQQPNYQLNASSQPAPGYLASPPARREGRGRGLAWTAIVIAIVTVLVNPITSLVSAFLRAASTDAFVAVNVLYTITGILSAVLALVCIVLAAIAVWRGARVLGGIGIGAGAFPLASIILNTTVTPLLAQIQ